MTREQAVQLYETEWWKKATQSEIALFQLTQGRLCCPFDVFQEAVEKTLGRPVFTHEFGLNRDGLLEEMAGRAPAPSLEAILALIPEDKRVLVIVSEPPRPPTPPSSTRPEPARNAGN